MRKTRVFLCGVAALAVAACGSDEPADGPSAVAGDSESSMHVMRQVKDKYDVTYQPGTVIVSDKAMQYMATPVIGSNRLEFSIDAKPHLDLEKNQVTIFPMAALVRVISWEEQADRIVIHTGPATLTEAIKDAVIQTEVRIDWQELAARANEAAPGVRFSLFSDAVASDELSTSFSHTWKHDETGLKINFKLKPESADKLGFEITASAGKKAYKKSIKRDEFARLFPTRYANANAFQPVAAEESLGPNSRFADAGGTVDNARTGGDESESYQPPDAPPAEAPGEPGELTASVSGGTKGFAKASGHMSGFSQLMDLQIRDGEVQDFVLDFKSLSGEIKLEAASLQGLVSTFNLSVPIEYTFTVPVGGIIPLTFTLGADVSFRPIIEQGTSGSSKLCFVIAYDGSTGLEWSDGAFSNQSTVTRREVDTCPDQETVSAGRLTVGMGATFNFPKFKVSLFHLPIATAIYVSSDGVTTYEPGIASALPACQAGKVDLKLVVEATMQLLGLVDTKVQAKLWQGKKEWTCDNTLVVTEFDKNAGDKKRTSDL